MTLLPDSRCIPAPRFILGERIGYGGYGAVFFATWNNNPCAAKLFYVSQSDLEKKAIQDEVNLLQQLRHRNIIQFFLTHVHEGTFYLITDIAENGSLAGALGRQQFDWPTRSRITHEIARGLEYIHQQKVIHRDLKSANVLLSRHMEVKLCDFGLATVKTVSMSQSQSHSKSQSVGPSQKVSVQGTMRWMAPELLASKPNYSAKSDVYALGMVMWELAADCNKPFKDQSNNTIIGKLIRSGERIAIPEDTPGQFRVWIESCWHQDPTLRPEASEVVLIDDGPEVHPVKEEAKGDLPAHSDTLSMNGQNKDASMEVNVVNTMAISVSEDNGGSSDVFSGGTISLTTSQPEPASERPSTRNLTLLNVEDLLQEANENNNAEAQVRLADKYDKGDGVPKNVLEAYFWRVCAANQGHARAQVLAGDMVFYGHGTLKDEQKAIEWYTKAADHGNPSAMRRIAWLHEHGRGGFVKSSVMALSWYRRGALKGDAVSQRCLGDCYLQARGTVQDEKAAKRWYLSAADQGDVIAQRALGWLFLNGRGVERNDAEALRWYRAAAEQEDADALCSLGYLYERGQGVGRDDGVAAAFYRKAALLGNAAAQNNLASLYFSGRGVEQNDEAALSWYLKAAAQGYTLALNSLGWMHEHGRGVEKDDDEAARWYQKAATKGNLSAQLRLAHAYEQGKLSLPEDVGHAVELYRHAAAQGSSGALTSLARLKKGRP